MTKRYYAAYGSNLNLSQMMQRCPGAKPIGAAIIEGYELLFKGSRTGSYLTIEPSVKNHVPVGVFEVTPRDEKNLDRYEGFPALYYKKEMEVPVRLNDGKTKKMKIFVYIMDERRIPGIPSQFYLDTCLQGYEDFGFDMKYLYQALERSKGDENKHREESLPQMRQRIHRISGTFQKR